MLEWKYYSSLKQSHVIYHKDHLDDIYKPYMIATLKDTKAGHLFTVLVVKMTSRTPSASTSYLVTIQDSDGIGVASEVFPDIPPKIDSKNDEVFVISNSKTNVTLTMMVDSRFVPSFKSRLCVGITKDGVTTTTTSQAEKFGISRVVPEVKTEIVQVKTEITSAPKRVKK